MNGKCAKRIRAAHLKSLNSGNSIGYKELKRQYLRYPYHKRYQVLVRELGGVPKAWKNGQVPGHSDQLLANLMRSSLQRNRRARGIWK